MSKVSRPGSPRAMSELHAANDQARSQSEEPGGVDMFFNRNGFDQRTRGVCDDYARQRFVAAKVTTPLSQGYCSYTLPVSDCYLLQFRPNAFTLNMDICQAAEDVFPGLAPTTTYLGVLQGIPHSTAGDTEQPQLHVYLQQKMPGVTLTDFRNSHVNLEVAKVCRRRMVEDLADVFALSFRHQCRSDNVTKGQIGTSLRQRLELLKGLCGEDLGHRVTELCQEITTIEGMPWCLTHGDLVPANIMVDPVSGHLTGLIDWAEGEWLPFGIGLYGLEEVLGEEVRAKGFQYYPEHEELRDLFWERIFDKTAQSLYNLPSLRHTKLSRDLGILLWRGIAFEDGRIDRVAETGRDDSELHKLELFLKARNPSILEGAG